MTRTGSKNLDMVQHLYDRPTPDQAVVEVMKDYIRYRDRSGVKASPEFITGVAQEQMATERKERPVDGVGDPT